MSTFSRSARVAVASLAFLIVLVAASPFAHSATGDVTTLVSLTVTNVQCNHTLYGAVHVFNHLGNQIVVKDIRIDLLPSSSDFSFGSAQDSKMAVPVESQTSQNINFAFVTTLTGSATVPDPEVAQVVAEVFYTVPPDSTQDTSTSNSVAVSITGWSSVTPATVQQSSSAVQQTQAGNSGSSSANSIPEFPLQPLAMVAFIIAIAGTYLLARRGKVATQWEVSDSYRLHGKDAING